MPSHTSSQVPPTFTGQPIPKTFADYQALAAKKQDRAQRIASGDGGMKANVWSEINNESEIRKCHIPRLRRVARHDGELEEKEYREGLLSENGDMLERRHSLKRKAEEVIGMLKR